MITTANNLKVMITEEQIQERIKTLAYEINDYYNGEEIVVICVLKGAVMFTVDLVKHLNMPLKMEFVKLSSYGNEMTSSGKVQSFGAHLEEINGKKVLIVEDIIDTGLTAEFLINHIKENYKPKDLKFCSLLNKKASRKNSIEPDYYGFEIDSKFVVGYGLDDEGYNRNLNYIGYKEV